jgi:catechol 2,3-dioxygenase-like lactoylglutathione lyase family enzyme
MAIVRLSLLVLKTGQLDRLRGFYAALGIGFAEERHGAGPTHHAGRVGDVVLELYPLPEGTGPADATTRLGFAVPDLDAAVQSLEAAGGTVATRPRRTEWGYRAVVRDPDGRAVEVCREDRPLSGTDSRP